MANFVDNSNYPNYGEWWEAPDGLVYWLLERSFPRGNRMLCLMQEIGSEFVEYFVFPY